MQIPLLDLKAQYKNIKSEINEAVQQVLESSQFILGPNVKSFEKEIADYIGVKHAIGVGNGTDALLITLKAYGIGEGDEVITTPFTFFATAETISQTGAVPIFVDVDLKTFNMDVSQIEQKITPRTKAIMPVHIFGQPADMDEILQIAQKHNIIVIEDACQAIGAEYKNKKIGSLGHAACFSFFPTKNLGGFGDGGMIVTNDENIATICRALRAHGSGAYGHKACNLLNNIQEKIDDNKNTDNTVYNPLKYYNYLIGYNSRLDELQAAILRIKLKHLDSWNDARRQKAKIYTENIDQKILNTPYEKPNRKHVYHLYIVQSENKEKIVAYLKENGIATGIYYPVPLHLQKVYKNLGYHKEDLPNAEYLSKRTFAIPLYPELTDEQQNYIIEKINSYQTLSEKASPMSKSE
jgi:dTDP-4-amino-4,6-dideoxygalactose transaminase